MEPFVGVAPLRSISVGGAVAGFIARTRAAKVRDVPILASERFSLALARTFLVI